jgi:hypothetical protein
MWPVRGPAAIGISFSFIVTMVPTAETFEGGQRQLSGKRVNQELTGSNR